MATFKIYRNEYTPAQINTLCSVDGNLVFDRSTSRIYCGIDTVTNSANLYGSNVQDVVYNTAGRILTITYCDGTYEEVTIDKIIGYTTPIYRVSGDTSFDAVINSNIIQNNDTFQTAINKLDTKSKTIVDSLINDERVILEGFAAVKDNVGLDNFFKYHSDKPTLQGVTTVSDAIDSLADYLVVVNTVSAGLAPHVTNTSGFLKGDGTWVETNKVTSYTAPEYPTTGKSSFDTVIQNNTVAVGDELDEAINKLDNKEKAIVDNILENEETIVETFLSIKESVGLDNDFAYSSNKLLLQNIDNVHDAVDLLADTVSVSYGVVTTAGAGFAPQVTNTGGFLRGDGSWSLPSGYELTSNKVTVINSNSTDIQYPSAKAVYDVVGDINSVLEVILNGSN